VPSQVVLTIDLEIESTDTVATVAAPAPVSAVLGEVSTTATIPVTTIIATVRSN
jgi:hypothetical protein